MSASIKDLSRWRYKRFWSGTDDSGRHDLISIVIVVSLFITVPWLSSAGWAASSSTASRPVAHYQAEGLKAFQNGNIEQAITHWQDASRLYGQLQQPQAQSRVLTHLAQAYSLLGHDQAALHSLQMALKHAQDAGDSSHIALILADMAHLNATMGKSQTADQLLQDALTLSREVGEPSLTSTILYTRGNLLMLQQNTADALDAYRQSATLAAEGEQHGDTARALIHAAIAAQREEQVQTAITLLESALIHLNRVPNSYDKASEWLLIGRAYHRLSSAKPTLILSAADAYRKAADIAQTLTDQRTLSYARGYLGRLYEEEARYPEALALTRRAVMAAQQVPESLYRWQWQTGRLLQAIGQAQPALDAYERAIETVQSIRTALLRRQRREHLSFRQTLGPLYFEYANLLLRKAEALPEEEQAEVYPQYEIYLHHARTIIEQFKTQELRDYFGDECVDAAHQRTVTIDDVSSDAVVVYPILLPDRTELLVSLPGELKRKVIPVTGADLEQRVRVFRNALEARDPRRYLRHAQRLYSWLIQPIAGALQEKAIQTLVFVPDGALRLLPIAALHDGQQYLIETYAVSVTPSLTLTEPQSLSRENLNVLVAGLTESVAGFPALPHVAEEVRNVQQLYGATVLLDQAFSPERLQQTVQEGDFGIVHIAAHGHFAPESAESFLLTGQGKLTFDQLTQIVGRLRFRDQPLELLTLSACETAHGDDRAALGLAGIAIQAGARSALATLWRVKDAAATRLMTSFYQHLQDPTISRARALQKAQLELLQDRHYANPFFWAPFLLINNWL